MSKPELVRNGDEFGLVWKEEGVSVIIDQLREGSDGLKGEITVEAIGAGHLIWGNFNLSSTSARATLGRTMSAKMKGPDWYVLLDQAAVMVARDFRKGEGVFDLSGLPEGNGFKAFIPGMFMPIGETSTIFADGGSCKSYVALVVAACVARGRDFPWGGRPLVTGPVLYLDWETTAQEQTDRLRWLCRGWGIDAVSGIHYRHQVRPLADDIAKLTVEVDRLGVVLVVVDSLGAACGGEPEKADVMLRVFGALRQFKGITRLVVTHISKAGAEGKNKASPFGSVYVRNESRSVWELRRSENDADENIVNVGFFHDKVNAGKRCSPFALRFIWDQEERSLRIRRGDLMEDEGLSAKTSLSFRIRQALRGGALTVVELAEEIAAKENTIYAAIKRMNDVKALDLGGGGRGKQVRYGLAARFDDGPVPF